VTLYGAVQAYIDGKHARGVVFEEAAKILQSFSKRVGDVPLDTIMPTHILDFLNRPPSSYTTWCVKFSLLKFFFEHWSARGLVDRLPMPRRIPAPLALRQAFVPYVYSRNEVRLLLQAIPAWETRSRQYTKSGRMLKHPSRYQATRPHLCRDSYANWLYLSDFMGPDG
jgi:hypothetical protein